MKDAAIVPDGQVVLTPAEAHLQVVIFCDDLEKICLEDLAFPLRDIIVPSVLDLVSGAEEALPPGNGIGANYRMGGCKVDSSILGCPSVLFDQIFTEFLGYLDEVGLIVGGS